MKQLSQPFDMMTSQTRSVSLPQLRNDRRHKGKYTHCDNEDYKLSSMPSTPSTAASSRPTSSSLHRSIGWTRQHLDERPLSSSTYSSRSTVNLGCPKSKGVTNNTASIANDWKSLQQSLPEAATRRMAEVKRGSQRPDEELLQCVRTDATFDVGDSVEYIYDLIREGEDVNQRSERGLTPLALSAAVGSEYLAALLLEKRAEATIGSVDRSELPLHYAACMGHQLICQLLLGSSEAKQTLDATSAPGWSPLHLAVVAGHEDVVQSLLRMKSLPDTASAFDGNHTSIHLAAMSGHANALGLLLDYDGDANAIDSLGRAPLHFAARRADAACVALLLRNKADPLRRGGAGDNAPFELVPSTGGIDRDRTNTLFSAYVRQEPKPLRIDTRFDLPGRQNVLSAYRDEGSCGLSGFAGMRRVTSSPQVTEWPVDDEVWL